MPGVLNIMRTEEIEEFNGIVMDIFHAYPLTEALYNLSLILPALLHTVSDKPKETLNYFIDDLKKNQKLIKKIKIKYDSNKSESIKNPY